MADVDPYSRVADDFLGHYRTLRGALRYRLLSEQMDRHIPPPPCPVVDVGGGGGHQAVRLARAGYEVTLVDPSRRMLGEAEAALAGERPAVRARVRLIEATGESAPTALEGERYPVVCCQAVLPYVEEPATLLRALRLLAAPGAVLSLVFKNADALVGRAALEGRWGDALAGFAADRDVGGLGVETRAHTLGEISTLLGDLGFTLESWYGIRVFSDHLHDVPLDTLDEVLPVESRASERDPYRALGRLIHLIGRLPPSSD